jgi:hypothetical protein
MDLGHCTLGCQEPPGVHRLGTSVQIAARTAYAFDRLFAQGAKSRIFTQMDRLEALHKRHVPPPA